MSEIINSENKNSALEDLVVHVDKFRKKVSIAGTDKDSDGVVLAEIEKEKSIRSQLMDAVIQELGMTKKQLMTSLNIDPSTWSRWSLMLNSPTSHHLNSLKRLKSENKEKIDDEKNEDKKHSPLTFLSSKPRTISKIMLLETVYTFNTAIYAFETTYAQPGNIRMAAQLALRGTSIIYLMDGKERIEKWKSDFISQLFNLIGKTHGLRVLSKIAVIEVDTGFFKDSADPTLGYAFYNFFTKSKNRAVGYECLHNGSEPPKADKRGVYEAFGFDDDRFLKVRSEYGHSIVATLNELHADGLTNLWATTEDNNLLRFENIKTVFLDNQK